MSQAAARKKEVTIRKITISDGLLTTLTWVRQGASSYVASYLVDLYVVTLDGHRVDSFTEYRNALRKARLLRLYKG